MLLILRIDLHIILSFKNQFLSKLQFCIQNIFNWCPKYFFTKSICYYFMYICEDMPVCIPGASGGEEIAWDPLEFKL